MMRVGVIFGGRSGEHEISLMSAASVIRVIDRNKYEVVPIGITRKGKWLRYDVDKVDKIEDGSWQADAESLLMTQPEKYAFTVLGSGGKSLKDIVDFALPIIHGPYCEDGKLQGLLETVNIPYAGSGVAGSCIAMDKAFAKEVFVHHGLPVCPYILIDSHILRGEHQDVEKRLVALVEDKLKYPVFVKPANMGSSVGISKVNDSEDLLAAARLAAGYDRRIVIEEGVDARELETAILGNDAPIAGAVGEIMPSEEFYDYKAKYFDGGESKLSIPADIPKDMEEEIRELAIKAYQALDCYGYSRVDFLVEKRTGRIFINEINTLPGFTNISMFPLLFMEKGMKYDEIIEEIIRLGIEKFMEKDARI